MPLLSAAATIRLLIAYDGYAAADYITTMVWRLLADTI